MSVSRIRSFALAAATALAIGGVGRVATSQDVTRSSAAVARGGVWLQSHLDEVQPGTPGVVAWLERAHLDGPWRHVLDLPVALDAPDPAELLALRRLQDGSHRVEEEIVRGAEGAVESMLLPALYCDVYTLEPSWWHRVDAAIATGRYRAAHAGLALAWAWDLGCVEEAAVRERRAELVPVLTALAEAEGHSDLGFEAVLVLLEIGRHDAVEDAWMQAIVDGQNEDGGWGRAVGAPSDEHVTVVAMAALARHDAGASAGSLVDGAPRSLARDLAPPDNTVPADRDEASGETPSAANPDDSSSGGATTRPAGADERGSRGERPRSGCLGG